MSKRPEPQQRVLDARCSQCNSQLNLRLPKDLDEGEFTVRCYHCSTRLDVFVGPDGRSRKVTVQGKQKRTAPKQQNMEPRPELVGPPKIDLDRGRLPYKKRLRAAFVMMVIVGILGVMSSLLTLSESFRIKDLDEQSPNDTADLNLWVLDETTGRGVFRAEVTLSSNANQTTYSDQEGLVVISDVKIGSMVLTISKEGYRTVSGRIVVKKGTPNVLDIPLKKGNPSDIDTLPVQQFKDKTYNPLYTDTAATLMMLSALMAFVSAIFVQIRDFFFLALIGAFLSIFSLGFFIGSILALFGFILIILSYEGFEHHHHLSRYLEIYGKGARNIPGPRIRTANRLNGVIKR
ncbi:MAG: glucosyltransferase domain-containing protein [Candidatus Thermoplasmatota archaeon]|jgi:DNA-directed RNA polymerase subunit RPC12/RpoP|nr:glucosyltransferase domain-containing protein [Candidatus Thermoplasmatota archaeon]